MHWSVSAQSALLLQQLGTAACWQPVGETQVSLVHALPSLQFVGEPGAQLPPLQVSPVVQASPSSHGALLLLWTHPVAGLQLSSVQTFPSLQFGAGPPTQLPPLHVSLVVHALPSSQGALLLVWTHPVAGLQLSSVQALLSLQFGGGPPTHAPLLQVSLVVQALPSSHGPVLFACVQPLAGLQESVVQTLLSLQSGGGPPAQLPPAQWSPVVHALPSSQGSLLFTCVQPVAGLQESVVHPLLSLQLGGGPPTQVPLEHWSLVVH